MASGGFRAAAGRPRRARPKAAVEKKTGAGLKRARPKAIVEKKAALERGRPRAVGIKPRKPLKLKLLPLDYMLDVMNDTDQPPDRRDRMAVAAAPYVHAKAADQKLGKKEVAEKEAQSAGLDPEWGDDLSPNVARPN
jgi:hypothetical protein